MYPFLIFFVRQFLPLISQSLCQRNAWRFSGKINDKKTVDRFLNRMVP